MERRVSIVSEALPSSISCADFLISTITACMVKSRACKPKVVAGPVGGEHGTDGGYPLSSCARFLLGFQVFTWNVACIGSIVVVVVFWTSLVRIDGYV